MTNMYIRKSRGNIANFNMHKHLLGEFEILDTQAYLQKCWFTMAGVKTEIVCFYKVPPGKSNTDGLPTSLRNRYSKLELHPEF